MSEAIITIINLMDKVVSIADKLQHLKWDKETLRIGVTIYFDIFTVPKPEPEAKKDEQPTKTRPV